MREPETILMLRVQIVDNEIRRHNDGMPFDAGDENFILTNMVTYTSDRFRANRWDSFEMPLPPAVPLGGDALLVLVLYAEAEALPTAGETYLSFLTGPFGAPIEIVEINPMDWSGSVWLPPSPNSPDEARRTMRRIARRIARDSLTTLLSQRGSPNGNFEALIDPNAVVPGVLSDPDPTDPGVDPVE